LDFTADGLSAVPSTQSSTAIVKSSSEIRSVVELVVPSLDIDTMITIPANLAKGGYVFDESSNFGSMAGLSYVSFGVWLQSGGPFSRFGSMTAFAFGYETPSNAMPTSGKADYKGVGRVAGRAFVPTEGQIRQTFLTGDAQLTADFATGKIDGVLNLKEDTGLDYFPPWLDVSVTANIASGSNRFSGTTGVTGSPAQSALKNSATGFIDGAFYGPDAENLGAVWTLGDGSGSAIGSVGAERQ
jgi:hypothetical protein